MSQGLDNHQDGPHDESQPQIPQGLAEAIRSLDGGGAPPMSAALRSEAERRLSGSGRARVWRYVGAAGAIAAALLLIVWMLPSARAPIPGDVDRSGHVNILDAFAIARALDHGGALDPAWDMNGDGVVDQRDVDVVAMRSVSLGGDPS